MEDFGWLLHEAVGLTEAVGAIFEHGEGIKGLDQPACVGGAAVTRQLKAILAGLLQRHDDAVAEDMARLDAEAAEEEAQHA